MGSKIDTFHVNMLRKYVVSGPDVDMNNVTHQKEHGATVELAGVIHQDVDLEWGEVPDLEGYFQREGVHDVKLSEELPKDQFLVLKDLVRRYPDVFTNMPRET